MTGTTKVETEAGRYLSLEKPHSRVKVVQLLGM